MWDARARSQAESGKFRRPLTEALARSEPGSEWRDGVEQGDGQFAALVKKASGEIKLTTDETGARY